jgi:hypothetical protein
MCHPSERDYAVSRVVVASVARFSDVSSAARAFAPQGMRLPRSCSINANVSRASAILTAAAPPIRRFWIAATRALTSSVRPGATADVQYAIDSLERVRTRRTALPRETAAATP